MIRKSVVLIALAIIMAIMIMSCEKKETPPNAVECSKCEGKGIIWPSEMNGLFFFLPDQCPECNGNGYTEGN